MNLLPSWNESRTRTKILDFIARVTNPGGPDFVAPAERIAAFDNDGTLWCEHPAPVQVFFLMDRARQLAAKDPAMKDHQPFKALLERDVKALSGLGKQALAELFFRTHAGVTVDEFERIARAWFDTAKHPRLGRLFKNCTFRPQVELLELLRRNGFKTFVVSGGGIDFIRAFAEEAYGIPSEQVIGSSARLQFKTDGNRAALLKLGELQSFDDRDAKPQNIGLHIGRRPVFACGNSDGDLAFMRYTLAGPGARFALLIHHDDGAREFAYDRNFRMSPLAEALDKAGEYGITVASMERDWSTVFGDAEP